MYECCTDYAIYEDENGPDIYLTIYGTVSSGGSFAYDSDEPPYHYIEINTYYLSNSDGRLFETEITQETHPEIFKRLTDYHINRIEEALIEQHYG